VKNKERLNLAKATAKIWVIRAGVGGEADELFLSEGLVALRDPGMGDLKQLPKSRQAFHETYRKISPDETKTGIAGISGKFFRFVNEVALGDSVLYPRLKDKRVYFGTIKGDYCYSTKPVRNFPHQRKVVWVASISKGRLSEFARRELGAARTFFRLKTHTDEIYRIFKVQALKFNKTKTRNKVITKGSHRGQLT
jgi:restriction system protein